MKKTISKTINTTPIIGYLLFVIWLLAFFPMACEAKSVWNGDRNRNVVALTFDDGPKPEFCQPILDILDRFGAKATFFVVGREAQENPDLIMRMEDSGHEIGNHTYSHIAVKDKPVGEALGDIQKCSEVIYNITGKQPKYFRPPGGGYNTGLSNGMKKMGLKTVYWSFNAVDYIETTPGYEVPEDFQAMAKELSKRIVDKVTPGTIILLHNGSEQTVLALPFILTELKKKGYGFVTVSDIVEGNI
jgi:peptidoglycan/xylan/chitin deacetylase (PgdA/CDA1 family)